MGKRALLALGWLTLACSTPRTAESPSGPSTAPSTLPRPAATEPQSAESATEDAEHAGRPDKLGVRFPSSVAGFAFGMSGADYVRQCAKAGGQSSTVDEKERLIMCLPRPFAADEGPKLGKMRVNADGLLVNVDAVSVSFCNDRICEIYLLWFGSDRTHTTDVLKRIEKRYGPGLRLKPEVTWPCKGTDRAREFRKSWFWIQGQKREQARVAGNVLQQLSCDEDGAPVLVLIYRDEDGFARRAEAYERMPNIE